MSWAYEEIRMHFTLKAGVISGGVFQYFMRPLVQAPRVVKMHMLVSAGIDDQPHRGLVYRLTHTVAAVTFDEAGA
ncbi:hypothetical protein D3C77_567440 [compost metagenome]